MSNLVVTIFCINFVLITSIDLPADFPKCGIDDPEVNECILKAAVSAQPYLKEGIKEFDISPLNQYTMSNVILNDGREKTKFRMNASKFIFYGMEKYNLTRVSFKKDHRRLVLNVYFDELPYHVEVESAHGYLHHLHINGNGTIDGTLEKVSSRISIRWNLEERQGVSYMKLKSVDCTLIVGEIRKEVEGLFGDADKDKEANEYFTVNPKSLATELTPLYGRVWERAVYSYIGQITKSIPYKVLFSVDEKML